MVVDNPRPPTTTLKKRSDGHDDAQHWVHSAIWPRLFERKERHEQRNAINVDGSPDLMGKAGQLLHAMRERAGKAVCLLDARMRTLTVEPEEGAATAEYAVVLVAATGFAAVLVGIMKSDAIKTLLTNIIKKALSVG